MKTLELTRYHKYKMHISNHSLLYLCKYIQNVITNKKQDFTASKIFNTKREDTKGVGFFITNETKDKINNTPTKKLKQVSSHITKLALSEQCILNSPNKWEQKIKHSLIRSAIDFTLFQREEKKKEEKNSKISYLESKLEIGDLLYLNEPNNKKKFIKTCTLKLAKKLMIHAKNFQNFPFIHTAIYIGKNKNGNGEICHIRRNKNGTLGKKIIPLFELFNDNKTSEVGYSATTIGRLNLSATTLQLFVQNIISTAKNIKSYSNKNAISAAVNGIIEKSSNIDVNSTSIICTDLPRIAAKKLLLEGTNLSIFEIQELEKLTNSNSVFDMFIRFLSPLSVNIKDFTYHSAK